MKINISNLGLIGQANIELADLTIVCGENNTGKTYVTYLIYCLLQSWQTLTEIDIDDELEELRQKGSVQINLQHIIVDHWQELCKQSTNKLVKRLPDMLAAKNELFTKFQLEVEIPLDSEALKQQDYNDELRSPQGNLLLTLSKEKGSFNFEITSLQTEGKPLDAVNLERFIEDRLLNFVFDGVIPDVMIASTERTGATTFKKQLNLATTNLLELLSQSHKEGEQSITPMQVFETMYARREYALPVQQNVRFINQLPNVTDAESELCQQHPELLKSFETIVGGTYVTNKDGATHFKPKGTTTPKLSLGEVSSSVRSLMIVWYWLKYEAKKGGMLIIDEPELNLHPANQRRLARFLVALVNHGVKVFITTHSDYIVREFNTLIMLNNVNIEKFPTSVELSDYLYTDRLDHNKVKMYITSRRTKAAKAYSLSETKISSEFGIDAPNFDAVIRDMQEVQDFLRYGDYE